MVYIGPELHQSVFRKEGGAQISLRIQIHSDGVQAKVGIHPCQVVNDRCFPDTSLVIKESQYAYAQGRLLKVASTCASSTSYSKSGLPFAFRACFANAIPTPNRCT